MITTRAEAAAHQAKHFGPKAAERVMSTSVPSNEEPKSNKALPKPVRMTKPEREYSLILEAKKRRGEIADFKFEGISLSWGTDPETGRKMWYTPDFWVLDEFDEVTLIEVKGKTLFYTALVRFKGARAEWGMHFKFELHQLEAGEWRRVE